MPRSTQKSKDEDLFSEPGSGFLAVDERSVSWLWVSEKLQSEKATALPAHRGLFTPFQRRLILK